MHWPSVSLTHYTVQSESLWTLVLGISTLRNWFRRIGMVLRDWRVVFPHFPLAQNTLSSVRFCLSLSLIAFVECCVRLSFNHLMYFMLLKVVFYWSKLACLLRLLRQFSLLSQCVIISWNQTGILNSKWIQIPMFIVSTFFAVSSVPLYRWHRYIDTALISQLLCTYGNPRTPT